VAWALGGEAEFIIAIIFGNPWQRQRRDRDPDRLEG
jgi:hypothetical protein